MDIMLYPQDSRLARKLKAFIIRKQMAELPVTMTEIGGRLDGYWKQPRDQQGRFVSSRYGTQRVP